MRILLALAMSGGLIGSCLAADPSSTNPPTSANPPAAAPTTTNPSAAGSQNINAHAFGSAHDCIAAYDPKQMQGTTLTQWKQQCNDAHAQ